MGDIPQLPTVHAKLSPQGYPDTNLLRINISSVRSRYQHSDINRTAVVNMNQVMRNSQTDFVEGNQNG